LAEHYKPKGLTLSSLRSLWSSQLQADTPEEEEVFRSCLRNTKKSITNFAILGTTITSGISLMHYDKLPIWFKFFGVFVGVTAGGMYGLVRTTKTTLSRFEDLGSEY
jgi:hypothetical protein